MSHRDDILEGPVPRVLLSLAWPIVLSNELVVLVGAITYFWMGRLAGTEGLAILAVMTPVATAVAWLFGSVGMGAGSIIARSVGARDGDGLRIAASALVLTLAAAVALWLPGLALARPISLALAGPVPHLAEFQAYFVTWLLLALPTLAAAEVLLDTANASGWTKFGLGRVILDLVLIGTLLPVFMVGLDFGPKSAPLVTGIAGALLVVLMWGALRRSRERLGLGERGAPLGRIVDKRLWRRLLEIGLPPQLGRVSTFVAQIFIVGLVSRAGSAAVAGYGLAFEVLFLASMSTMGLAQANAIFIGQNLGASQPARCLESFKKATAITLGLVCLALFGRLFADSLFELFIEDRNVVSHATAALGTMAWGLIGLALFQICIASFTATGHTKMAGVVVVGSEVVGVLVAFTSPLPALESAAVAFVVANSLKGGAMACLIPSAFLRVVRRAE